MNIKTVTNWARPISAALLPFLTLYFLDVAAYAQDKPGQEEKIENARWRVEGELVVITYDLVGDADLSYEVNVTLSRESDRNFKLVPRTVRGAVGKGKFAGTRMEIRWDYKRDVPQGLEGEDYAFEFVINVIREEGGSNLWYYLGGLGVAGAAAAAVLLGGSKQASAPTATGLPAPPSERPPSQ